MGDRSYIVNLTKGDRIRIKFHTTKNKVTSFVVNYEALAKNRWREIVRYDTFHGFVHQDILHYRKKSDKIKLDITDLNQAMNYAIQDIKARWRNYREKFEKEIK